MSLQRLDSHIWSRTTSHVFIVGIATVLPTIESALTTGLIRAEIRDGLQLVVDLLARYGALASEDTAAIAKDT